MSLIKEKFDTTMPLPSILLQDWKDKMKGCDAVIFDSLDQFVYTVSKLTQKNENTCEISYTNALRKLIRKESDFPKSTQESVRNTVRSNLFKRGLITQEIYENFRYTTDGTQVGVDVGKYAAGEPDCVLTPAREYIDFFYEMYINISYSAWVEDNTIRDNLAKLLATVEELERQHIFIKINAVLPITNPKVYSEGENNKFFSIIPLFSHKDFKSVDLMSSVVNDRLLRKFYFAILEDLYGSKLSDDYGEVTQLSKAIDIGNDLNEIELFENIVKIAGA